MTAGAGDDERPPEPWHVALQLFLAGLLVLWLLSFGFGLRNPGVLEFAFAFPIIAGAGGVSAIELVKHFVWLPWLEGRQRGSS